MDLCGSPELGEDVDSAEDKNIPARLEDHLRKGPT